MVPGKNKISVTEPRRERFSRMLRRKLAERGYSGEELEAKLREITSKEDISFNIDWDKVMKH